MGEHVRLPIGESVRSESGVWYRSLQMLGTGGNAATFLVVATTGRFQGILFAAKVFRRLSRPERRVSFLHEIDFLTTCNHPSVMRVFDRGVFQDVHPFVVAEYLPATLQDVIGSGLASTVEKLTYAVQLLSALSYLAGLNRPVVHRDIKPQNVFTKGQSCVLGDFGLMKFVDATDDGDRQSLKESVGHGMPKAYRTPDLVDYLRNGKPPTCKSDVYQLGLVLAELFTGRNPQKAAQTFTDHVELHSIGSIPGEMGDPILSLIRRMLDPDPLARDAASNLLGLWQGVFLDAAKRIHALHGRVFD